jgi:VanZ family protein
MQQLMRQWLHKLYFWINNSIWPAIIWSALIFLLLVVPFEHKSEQSLLPFPNFDKVIHVFLFCIMSFLWSEYAKSKYATQGKYIFFIIVLSILYGILLEYFQHYTGRNFDPADMLANGCGAIIGVCIKKSRNK